MTLVGLQPFAVRNKSQDAFGNVLPPPRASAFKFTPSNNCKVICNLRNYFADIVEAALLIFNVVCLENVPPSLLKQGDIFISILHSFLICSVIRESTNSI